jgi:hypothetical protein
VPSTIRLSEPRLTCAPHELALAPAALAIRGWATKQGHQPTLLFALRGVFVRYARSGRARVAADDGGAQALERRERRRAQPRRISIESERRILALRGRCQYLKQSNRDEGER